MKMLKNMLKNGRTKRLYFIPIIMLLLGSCHKPVYYYSLNYQEQDYAYRTIDTANHFSSYVYVDIRNSYDSCFIDDKTILSLIGSGDYIHNDRNKYGMNIKHIVICSDTLPEICMDYYNTDKEKVLPYIGDTIYCCQILFLNDTIRKSILDKTIMPLNNSIDYNQIKYLLHYYMEISYMSISSQYY